MKEPQKPKRNKYMKLLKEPISFYFGKRVKPICLDCSTYSSHSLVYCPRCGKKFVAYPNITLENYMKKMCFAVPIVILMGYFSDNKINNKASNELMWYAKQVIEKAKEDFLKTHPNWWK